MQTNGTDARTSHATLHQRTIARMVATEGQGLHTGAIVRVRFLPGPVDSGVVFVRTDLPGQPRIAATAKNRIAHPRRTAICDGPAEVHTVEHLISAAVGIGLDNLIVEIDGPEAPGLDGSSARFVDLLRAAGAVDQAAPRRHVIVKQAVEVKGQGGATLRAEPWSGPGLKVTYTLDYPIKMLKGQRVELELDEDRYVREIAPARTFCLKQEAEMLKAAGLGKGATLENTVVYEDGGIVGGGTLRFPDEAARHKVLDLVGDLALLGARLQGHVIAAKSGHDLNLELVKALLAQAPA